MKPTTRTNLHDIIERDCLFSILQPLVSMKRKSLIGFEALIRAVDPDTGKILSPTSLFSLCDSLKSLTILDRACRKKAFETFAPISKKNRSLILSVNIDAAIIDNETISLGLTSRMAADYAIPASNVVLEIIESKAGDDNLLSSFVKNSRKSGFLIALDDIGTGHSNLDRIPRLKPDIIKIDRSLISNIDTKFHSQEVTRSLINLAERTGSLPLAEGVERIDEALALMEMGIDFFQGYYFAKPMIAELATNLDPAPIHSLASRFKIHTLERLNCEKSLEKRYQLLTEKLRKKLSKIPNNCFDATLASFITENTSVECAYILNSNGFQSSHTICNPYKLKENRRLIYHPAPLGADHSLKEYYLNIKSGKSWHTTAPYISQASGNRCVTVSALLSCQPDSPVLCIDVTSRT